MANKVKAKKPTLKVIARSAITVDEALQNRCFIDGDLVEQFIDDYRRGDRFKPMRVVSDKTGAYWLYGGFHRIRMYAALHVDKVECEVVAGERHDAVLLAAGENHDHGNRLDRQGKERSVIMLLNDDHWKNKSSNWIAEKAHVTDDFVNKVRKSHGPMPEKTVGKDGKERSTKHQHLEKPQHSTSKVDSSADNHGPPAIDGTDVESVERLGDSGPALNRPSTTVEDNYHRPVDARLIPVFEHRREINRILLNLAKLRTEYLVAIRHESRAGAMISLPTVEKALDDAIRMGRMGMPDAQCPACHGVEPSKDADDCKICDGRGWLHESKTSTLPNQLRKIVEQHLRKGA